MKWIKVHTTIVETENYRQFRLSGNSIIGLAVLEDDFETVCEFETGEQVEDAFDDFCKRLDQLSESCLPEDN